jgi:GT2 family glycosyltransferase
MLAPVAFKAAGGVRPTVERVLRLYRREGFAGVRRGLLRLKKHSEIKPIIGPDNFVHNDYAEWIRRYDTLDDAGRQSVRARIETMQRQPRISVLMPVYDPPLEFLDQAIQSVRKQLYPGWELCIADDASRKEAVRDLIRQHVAEDDRIKVVFHGENGHVALASNSALELVTGEFVALLDHDDLLPEHALFWVANVIIERPGVGIIYSDEDKLDDAGARVLPFFKPDWSPHLAVSQAYLGHLVCIRTSLLRELGGWRTGVEGAQDYDLWLRASLHTDDIHHIPKVLYHWRMQQASTARDDSAKPYAKEAGLRAVQHYLDSRYPAYRVTVATGEQELTYRTVFRLPKDLLVSIIIPTRDRLDLLRPCVESILSSTWHRFEVIILDNGSCEPRTVHYLENIQSVDARCRVVTTEIPFNWSRLNNIGAGVAVGQVLVFLNNDTVVITRDWLENLAGYAILPDVGTVGALLLFEDGTIQHSGVVVGLGGWADHVYQAQEALHSVIGPFVSPVLTRNVLAVTGACMAMSREKFTHLGGFDEAFTVCGSDVELGIRAHRNGLLNVICAEARLYHFHSRTRGPHVPDTDFNQSARKYAPYQKERVDPFYNPNLSLSSTYPVLNLGRRDSA